MRTFLFCVSCWVISIAIQNVNVSARQHHAVNNYDLDVYETDVSGSYQDQDHQKWDLVEEQQVNHDTKKSTFDTEDVTEYLDRRSPKKHGSKKHRSGKHGSGKRKSKKHGSKKHKSKKHGSKKHKSKKHGSKKPNPEKPSSSTKTAATQTKTKSKTASPPTPTTVNPPSNMTTIKKVEEVEKTIRNYIKVHKADIPAIIRGAFHDYINFHPKENSFGGQGCLVDDRIVAAFKENLGLDAMARLVVEVKKKHKNILSTGDIISLAGKLAVEHEIPCLKLAWEFGRPPCVPNTEKELGPSHMVSTMGKLKPFLNRYGITAEQMAILVVGGHGIKGARNRFHGQGSLPAFSLSHVSSGVAYIQTMFDSRGWNLLGGTWLELKGKNQGKESNLGRFPNDMMFFPSVMQKSMGRSEAVFKPVEAKLVEYSSMDRSKFDNRFGQEFSNILRVGTSGLTVYSKEKQC